MDLSVVIVNWNTRELLSDCLRSVYETAEGIRFEVFVVDNASTDGSAAMVRDRFPLVRLIENLENVGFARANNQAMRQANGRYALLLNSDTILTANNLLALMQFGNDHPYAGIVGVKLVNADGTFQAAFNDFPTWQSVLLETWGMPQRFSRNRYYPSYPPEESMDARPCNWVGGACLLARRAAIEKVGLLDEGFFMYSEEMDWCYRMWEKRWEVWYTPGVEVIHLGGASADRLSSTQRMRMYASKVRFIEKHRGRLAACAVGLNFRGSSFAKALGYELGCLIRRDDGLHELAMSHWEVALKRSWS